MCCCLQECCCGKTCNAFCWFVSCLCSYYTVCGSMMGFQLCKEAYEERQKRRRELEEEYKHLNRTESPNLQMINESEFIQNTIEIGLPNPEPYIQRDSITNKKIYVPRLKTIREY